MAQSYGRWGGKDVARDLLKTRQRSWYSVGTPERSAVSTWNTEDKEPGDKAAPKQEARQDWLQDNTEFPDQSTWGLCCTNHGCPRTTGAPGESRRYSSITSWWLPETTKLTEGVEWVIEERRRPLREWTEMGEGRGMAGMPHCAAIEISKKLPSAPESISAEQEWMVSWYLTATVSRVRDLGDSGHEAPIRIPRLTDGSRLLKDTG